MSAKETSPGFALNTKKVLLHACCVVCCGTILEQLQARGLEATVFFYNPNIHPQDEYRRRRDEQKKFCAKKGAPFIEADYDPDTWMQKARGLAQEPERGKRCTVCFSMRLRKAAQYAHQNGFKVFTSTLGLSRWKDLEQVNRCGLEAASLYPGLAYWTENWRKRGGSQRMYTLAKEENFYQQTYCGCVYSLQAVPKTQKPI